MNAQLLLSGLGVAATALLSALAWSLRRNLANLEAKLAEVATDVRQLSASVAGHSTELAEGGLKITMLEKRIDGIEDRERIRGCFGLCKVDQ